MDHPAQLSRIRLEPAPGPHEARDDASYDFVAPLSADGHIDVETWKERRALCFVHRIETGGGLRHGVLAHRPGGPSGAAWAFDYELGEGDEETGFRFETHAFTPGAYVSLRGPDTETRTYRVASVKPA